MDISKKEQTQTAGDNAMQNQFGNLNNCNVTINDKELIRAIATEVCSKEMLNVYRTCTQDAIELANKRDNMFAQTFIPRIEQIESAIKALKEPSFQFMIQDARETAAKTDRHDDLCLLSELLLCHVLKGDDKKIDAGISHAIKIVDEIDNDALCALTIVCALLFYFPNSGIIKDGLKILNDLFEKLLYLPLPKGMAWLDHLDMLGALRISSLKFKDSKKYFSSKYGEYVCIGLKKESQEYNQACTLLNDNKISQSVLVDNECLNGYVRLKIDDINDILPQYQDCIKKIWEMYAKDNTLINEVQNNFINLWDSYDSLKVVRNWWDAIPKGFEISYMGRVLAQTNAKRIDSSLPDLI